MPSVKVIRSLITSSGALAAAQLHAVERPQGDTVLPAGIVTSISVVPEAAVGMATQPRMSTDRVQVDLLAADYPGLKALVRAVDLACHCKSGLIAGVQVHQVLRALHGPEDRNEAAGLYSRQVDYLVTYTEP